MSKRRTLGWLGLTAAVIWLAFDYLGRIREAILAGWVTIALTLAHIFL